MASAGHPGLLSDKMPAGWVRGVPFRGHVRSSSRPHPRTRLASPWGLRALPARPATASGLPPSDAAASSCACASPLPRRPWGSLLGPPRVWADVFVDRFWSRAHNTWIDLSLKEHTSDVEYYKNTNVYRRSWLYLIIIMADVIHAPSAINASVAGYFPDLIYIYGVGQLSL